MCGLLLLFTNFMSGCGGLAAARDRDPSFEVRRGVLEETISAGGVTTSARMSTVRCQAERLKGTDRAVALPRGASTTILSVVPNGAFVRKGEVICRLDASAHEALVIEQKILVEAGRSRCTSARLDLQVAEESLREYRDGLLTQERLELSGKLAEARSQLMALAIRRDWLGRMLSKGYVSRAQVGQSDVSLESMRVSLDRLDRENTNHEVYEAPTRLRTLEARIHEARTNFENEAARLGLLERRLARLEKQVASCVIRAPHEAFVVHANRPKKDFVVEPGAPVRFRQEIMELIDPTEIEVEVLIHETVVGRVAPGMQARVRTEDAPELVLEGTLASLSNLPMRDRSKYASNETAYYIGRVVLREVPPGTHLGVSAEVEIVTNRKNRALFVPVVSLNRIGDSAACRVRTPEGIEVRPVVTGLALSDVIEIVEGLREHEEVLLQK